MGAGGSSLTQQDIEELHGFCNGRFTREEIATLWGRFRELDRSGSGFISSDEFMVVPEFALNPLAPRLLATVENMNFRDFLVLLGAFSPQSSSEEKLKFMFKIMDADLDGVVSIDDMLTILGLMAGDFLTHEQLEHVLLRSLRAANIRPESGLTYEEFAKHV
eukprot:jgi/Chlat1/8907/Chrsp92S08226